jgi:CBS domain-containing protein
MVTVRDLIERKRGSVLVVGPQTAVREAAGMMDERGVGSVLVMDGGKLAGIFTERDLMRRVVAHDLSPANTPVRDVMTTELVTCTPSATVADCEAMMSERHIRHLPVSDEGKILGVITTGDLLAHEIHEKEAKIRHLESFVFYVRQ